MLASCCCSALARSLPFILSRQCYQHGEALGSLVRDRSSALHNSIKERAAASHFAGSAALKHLYIVPIPRFVPVRCTVRVLTENNERTNLYVYVYFPYIILPKTFFLLYHAAAFHSQLAQHSVTVPVPQSTPRCFIALSAHKKRCPTNSAVVCTSSIQVVFLYWSASLFTTSTYHVE